MALCEGNCYKDLPSDLEMAQRLKGCVAVQVNEAGVVGCDKLSVDVFPHVWLGDVHCRMTRNKVWQVDAVVEVHL